MTRDTAAVGRLVRVCFAHGCFPQSVFVHNSSGFTGKYLAFRKATAVLLGERWCAAACILFPVRWFMRLGSDSVHETRRMLVIGSSEVFRSLIAVVAHLISRHHADPSTENLLKSIFWMWTHISRYGPVIFCCYDKTALEPPLLGLKVCTIPSRGFTYDE